MNNQDPKIEKYFSEEMSAEEIAAFEKELGNNVEMANEVADFRTTIKGVHDYGLKQKLKGIHKKVVNSDEEKSNQKYYYISGIAASLILIITIGYMFLFNVTASPSELYTAYHEPFPNFEKGLRGDQNSLKSALDSYTKGQYQKAIDIFNQLPKNESNSIRIDFYSAMSLMMLEKHTEAIIKLENMKTPNIFDQQINWYLGLAYLKMENIQKAKGNLQKIESDEYNYKEAQKILDSIK